MEFVKIPLNLPQDFKFMRFKDRLGIDDSQALGHLVNLWIWSFQYAQDGFFDKDLVRYIAQVAMWRGEPDVFIDALLTCGAKGQCGFLEETEDGYQLHDWEEFCGKAYEKRTKEAERKRVERAKRNVEPADVLTEVQSANANAAGIDGQGNIHGGTDENDEGAFPAQGPELAQNTNIGGSVNELNKNPADVQVHEISGATLTDLTELTKISRTLCGQIPDITKMSGGRPADNMRTSAPEIERDIEKEKRTKTNPARPEGLADFRADDAKTGTDGEARGCVVVVDGDGAVSCSEARRSLWLEPTKEGAEITFGEFTGLDFGKNEAEAVTPAKLMTGSPSLPLSLCPQQCPQQEIIELYHEVLPELPRVKTWGKTCQKYLKTRWKESRERQNMDWWRGYFESIRGMDWLMGRSRGQTSFLADLEWLITQKNMGKVLNGRYSKQNLKTVPPSSDFFRQPRRNTSNTSVAEYVAAFVGEDLVAVS